MNSEILRLREGTCHPLTKLEGFVDHYSYGIFCHCYAQPNDFLESALTEIYTDYDCLVQECDDDNISKGQKTVELIAVALNSISPHLSIKATPADSVADCLLKWDMILTWKTHNFPIQVKSSLMGVKKAIQKSGESQRKIGYCESPFLSKYAQMKIRDLSEIQSEMDEDEGYSSCKLQIHNYERSMPIYIWADTENQVNVQITISSLIDKFSSAFGLECDVQKSTQLAYRKFINLSTKESANSLSASLRHQEPRSLVSSKSTPFEKDSQNEEEMLNELLRLDDVASLSSTSRSPISMKATIEDKIIFHENEASESGQKKAKSRRPTPKPIRKDV